MKIDHLITELCDYAERCGLISRLDRAYAVASLMDILALGEYTPVEITEARPLVDILDGICDYAFDKGLIESDGVVYRDLFDTKIMGALTPRPSEVIGEFERLYATSPEAATDKFYKLACDSNYIRCDRVARDVRWKVASEYGDIDISINLSKPEKDPKAIAMARLLPQTDFPRCALCHENEGFAGNLSKPARQTLRQIPFEMAGESWYLQYSPYVYYNEHCIALSAEHKPMKIDRSSFLKLLGFVEHFPHYFIGSNADLPIVGGSILSHDHMQGGRYEFAMERAQVATRVAFSGFSEVEAGIVKWPMSVIRLRSLEKSALVELADRILTAWRGYTDADAFIFAETDGTPHNTITPIARMRGGKFELDLVLRNNITTADAPWGVYHPREERHNIKKENIGLIEVMGLAVLPARLKQEIELMCSAISEGRDFSEIPEIRKHADWFAAIEAEHNVTSFNAEGIIKAEIGRTFVEVLRDAGVYKDTDEGRAAFLRFLGTVGGREV
jgi:UDPglucose--hexose-1-phosphate uridylyltransferase